MTDVLFSLLLFIVLYWDRADVEKVGGINMHLQLPAYSEDEESAQTTSRDEISVEVTRYLLDKDTSLEILHR